MNKKNSVEKGSIMILNVLLFLIISVAILFSLSIPITSTTINSRNFLKNKQNFIIENSNAKELLFVDILNNQGVEDGL